MFFLRRLEACPKSPKSGYKKLIKIDTNGQTQTIKKVWGFFFHKVKLTITASDSKISGYGK